MPWHREVNKNANVTFAESAMGKKLKAGLSCSFLSHVKLADGSAITNCPVNFKCPHREHKRDYGNSSSGGKMNYY